MTISDPQNLVHEPVRFIESLVIPDVNIQNMDVLTVTEMVRVVSPTKPLKEGQYRLTLELIK